jgi:hypothetical protein
VKSFSYRIGTASTGGRQPDGYVQLSVDDPTFANPVVATMNANNVWTAVLPGVVGPHTIYARQVLSSALYNPEWGDVVVGPVAQYLVTI